MESGIYIYCNKINGKKYVGLSRNIEERLKGHFSESKNANPSQVIEKAIKKYGMENFYIIKIQYPKEELSEMEKYYIEFFNTYRNGYNCTTGGKSNFEVSEETKRKISEIMSLRLSLKENHPLYGKRHSEEAKKKMSKNHADFSGKNHPLYGKTHSEETRKKMSEAQKGKNNPNYGKKFSEETRKKIGEAKKGENHPSTKLTEEMVLDMRKMYKIGIRFKFICKKYKDIITSSGINGILQRKTWRHI